MIILMLLVFSSINNVFSLNCTDHEFACKWSNKCIDHSKRCNGEIDCTQKEDELGCVICDEQQRRCANDQCVDKEFWCDGLPDCMDASDEANCDQIKPITVQCQDGYFHCPNYVCIHNSSLCNGHVDCKNGEDEENCPSDTIQDQVACPAPNWVCPDKSQTCMTAAHFCDGTPDCDEGVDEDNCGVDTMHHLCLISEGKYPCKHEFVGQSKTTCLDVTQLCDGIPQCQLGDDEGDFCKNSTCSTLNCHQNCMETSQGPKCYCKPGYRMSEDGATCEDVDECLQYGVCDHICENTQGGYTCSCKDHYSLMGESHCRYEGTAQIYIAMHDRDSGEIRSYDPVTKSYMELVSNLTEPTGLGYWYNENQLIVTDLHADHPVIQAVKLRNQERKTMIETGLEIPLDVVVDSVSNLVYFTDLAKGTVSVCTLISDKSKKSDSTNCSVISRGHHEPAGIALHTVQKSLFLVESGDHPKIIMMTQDGKHSRNIVFENLGQPSGIFVDETIDRIFWTDSAKSVIESANLDGSDRRVVVTDSYQPYGIVVFENRVYWTDFDHFVLRSANKFTGNDIRPEELSYKGRMNSLALHMMHNSEVSQDPCKNHQCSHLCLPSGVEDSTCVCPEGMYIGHDSKTCQNLPSENESKLYISHGSHIHAVRPQHLGTIELETVAVESDVITATAGSSVANKVVVVTADNKLALVHTDWKTSNVLAEDLDIESLSHDNHNGNIFWIDNKDKTIKMMSEVTKKVRVVVHCFEPRALHYMYSEHMLVYVDGDTLLATRPDGQQIHLLASHLPQDVTAVTYSDKEDTYYFADQHFVYKYKSDVAGYQDIARVDERPVSLVVQKQYLYWTEEGSSSIFWIDLEQEKLTSSLYPHHHVYSLQILPETSSDLHISASLVPIDYSMSACSTKFCTDMCVVNENNHAHCLCGDGRVIVQDDLWNSCQEISEVMDTTSVPLTSNHITLIAVLVTTVLLVSLLTCFGCCYVRKSNFKPAEFINRSFGISPRKSNNSQEMSPVHTVKTGSLNEVYNPSYYSVSLASCPPIASSHDQISAPTFSASFRSEQEKTGLIPGILRSIRKLGDPKMSRIDLDSSASYESLVGVKGSSTPNSMKRRMETIQETDSACSLHSGQNSMEIDDISVDSDTMHLVRS